MGRYQNIGFASRKVGDITPIGDYIFKLSVYLDGKTKCHNTGFQLRLNLHKDALLNLEKGKAIWNWKSSIGKVANEIMFSFGD